ncbi:hypothetical protein SCP_0500890 [Sparassis crispa]|uniref:Amino acid transporter transmembrane domain-containing protein n=1 Tax=Sparassis crispa TaxID=139825 RepID=A0A401GLJ3_9APHY|nr:hypothetical protein SCP_0500890 [Sparassis crispa]GBE83045.1 hypothetical protein SCP_0500890 [Sparassis crispa]
MSGSPRSSTSAESLSSGRRSPIGGFDSSAALILEPDVEDTTESHPFDFTSDDETDDDLTEQTDRLLSSSVPPLSSLTVFLYLLSPFLKLGAFLVPDAGLPLRYGIPVLLFFAGLSALTRQIWYMLARYVRRADLEEIVLQTFARDRRKEGTRWLLRQLVRFGVGLLRVLIAALYLRAAVDVLLPLVPATLVIPPRVLLTIILAAVICPICFAPSLGATSVLYASWISVTAYAAWFACTAYAHAKGMLVVNPGSASLGILWEGSSIIAFAFSTSSTIPLYAALKGTIQAAQDRPRRSQSFKLLSVLSIGLAALCIFPLVFFQSPANSPTLPTATLKILTALSNAVALALSLPAVLISSPPLPIPFSIRHATNFPLSRSLLYAIILCLSLLPRSLSGVLSDFLLVLAFLSTYMLPAFIHITLHNFREPLSIIIPPSTPVTAASPFTPEPSSAMSDSRHDELLQRKERTLQRRRLGKRIIWDLGVWLLLVPVSGGGLVWAAGRIVGKF